MQLDDLVTVLRAFTAEGGGVIGCSIDPRPEGLKRINDLVARSNKKGALAPGRVKNWTDQLGNAHTAHTAYSKGHKNNPLDDKELEGKFRSFASGVLSDMQCEDVLGTIWAIDEATDMDDLFDGLVV